MSNSTLLSCARCGAELQPAPHASRVTCLYCGAVSELGRTAPPAPSPPAPVPTPRSHAFNWVYVWAALVLCVGVGGSLMARFSNALRSTATQQAQAAATQGNVPIQASDLKAVDPTALLQQAAAAVRQRASNCELTYAYFGEQLAGGVLDTTGYSSLFEWGCRSVDKSKPPGQDVADDEWSVRISSGTFQIQKTGVARHNNPPWVEPSCPFSQAWSAVVASGVPANALVRVYYRYSDSNRVMLWDLNVHGHPELSRQVEGSTCQVVREHR